MSIAARNTAFDGKRSSMGVAIVDVDGDGDDDIYVSDWGANHLHLRDAVNDSYESRARSLNADLTADASQYQLVAWGAQFCDFDRDTVLELVVMHGAVQDAQICMDFAQYNYVMRYSAAIERFQDITTAVGWPLETECPPPDGLDHPLNSRGVVLADLDGDHDDDIIVTPFNEKYRFYRNDSDLGDRHFLRVEPRGTVAAPSPYGAILEVERTGGSKVRRNLYAGGIAGQRYPLIEAGIDTDTGVTSATLHWPSGYSQRLDMHADFALDARWQVTEPEWLSLSTRVATNADPDPVITYRPADPAGTFIGAGAAGRTVTITRSDGVTATVTDNGDGTYTAPLPHPGATRITVLQITDNGETLRPRLTVNYQ